MKPTMLIGMLAVLIALFTGCEALLPPMVFMTNDGNANSGCQILITVITDDSDFSSPLVPGVTKERAQLYDTPISDSPDILSDGYTYVFHPVEYTFVTGAFWVKVWASYELEYLSGDTLITSHRPNGYKWIKLPFDFPPPQLPGCQALPLTDGIEGGRECLLLFRYTPVPARVGPGTDRAIFVLLTHGLYGELEFSADGYQIVGEKVWYRLQYNGRHLWVDGEAIQIQLGSLCSFFLPLVAAPPLISYSPLISASLPLPELSQQTEDFPVRHCYHIGNNFFEWVSARVTYDVSGLPLREDITGGPFQGEWRDGCPAGEITVQPGTVGEPPPTVEPTIPPTTPTPQFGQ